MSEILIGICDDNRDIRDGMKVLCDRWFAENKIQYTPILFSGGKEVLQYDGERMLLLLLDVEMPDMNGIEVMEHLVRSNKVWRIVFVTGYGHFVHKAFGLKTLGFVEKGYDIEKDLRHWLSVAIEEDYQNRVVQFVPGDKNSCYRMDEILYIEGSKNYIEVHTAKGKTIYLGNLKKWVEELNDMSMERVHKSYIVNFENVKSVTTKTMTLENGVDIPIGRLYQKKVKEQYRDYLNSVYKRR